MAGELTANDLKRRCPTFLGVVVCAGIFWLSFGSSSSIGRNSQQRMKTQRGILWPNHSASRSQHFDTVKTGQNICAPKHLCVSVENYNVAT